MLFRSLIAPSSSSAWGRDVAFTAQLSFQLSKKTEKQAKKSKLKRAMRKAARKSSPKAVKVQVDESTANIQAEESAAPETDNAAEQPQTEINETTLDSQESEEKIMLMQ